MKGIFLDLDGTLLNDRWEISDDDYKYLISIKNRYNIYLITGSSYSGAEKFYNQLNLDTWLVTSQGREISKPKENLKLSNFISKNIVSKVLKKNFKSIHIEGINEYYQSDIFKTEIRINKKKVDSPSKINKVLSILIEDSKPVLEECTYTVWETPDGRDLYIINEINVDKASALLSIKEMDDLEEIIYIGDGRNDIRAMKQADISIAMKNSFEEVKKNAKLVSKFTNNESGVSMALKKIVQ